MDVLLNNAGAALGLEPAQECSLDDWDAMVDTNIKGLLYATRAVLPGMVARNRGHIVMLGSVAGNYPYAGGNVYCGSKAFVKQFSLALRADLLGTNVHVTNIEPGLAESEFSIVRFHGDTQKAANVYEGTSPITPQDIAETVFWVTHRPTHININRVEIMPICQCPSGPLGKKRHVVQKRAAGKHSWPGALLSRTASGRLNGLSARRILRLRHDAPCTAKPPTPPV